MPTPGDELRLTYVGGPTALIELGGLRLLTDPSFDPAGAEFRAPAYTLRKTSGPAVAAHALGPLDAVLLSHDHHFDNLDAAGRALLPRAREVLTTVAGAGRLGRPAIGLAPGAERVLHARDGRELRVRATPARHGPPGGDRGPVIGFALRWGDAPGAVLYVSGDTVWYEEVAALLRREPVRVAVLFAGAARIPAVGPAHLTFTAAELVEAARACPAALIVPVHLEGWTHFSESFAEVEAAFAAAGLAERLRLVRPGRTIALPFA